MPALGGPAKARLIEGNGDIGVVPPPRGNLPGFPNAVKKKPKTARPGGGLRARWKDEKTGAIYERDYQHGAIEAYDSRGNHIGEYDPQTGQLTKGPDPTRKVEP
jgi:hypothetical protein